MNDMKLSEAAPLTRARCKISGYGSMVDDSDIDIQPATITPDYAEAQAAGNNKKTLEFILPLVERQGAKTVLDVGCGIGVMVRTLVEKGYDAYGIDLRGLETYWAKQDMPRERLFIIDPRNTELPFEDETIDFAFTLGAIEHVGTSNGLSDRLPDYRQIRRRWLLEILRVVRVGGSLLVGGPNRNFPVDVAHGLDTRASRIERKLSSIAGASIHKTWGENFLWGYRDLRQYLDGYDYEVEPLGIGSYLGLSRVPKPIRRIIQAYIDYLPRPMLGTGFNPWMIALIHKSMAFQVR
jgi:SAM-dependent methyltransferase